MEAPSSPQPPPPDPPSTASPSSPPQEPLPSLTAGPSSPSSPPPLSLANSTAPGTPGGNESLKNLVQGEWRHTFGVIDILVERICGLEGQVLEQQQKETERSIREEMTTNIDLDAVIALTSTVKKLEDTCKKQAQTIKTLAFNVSGHTDEDHEESHGVSSPEGEKREAAVVKPRNNTTSPTPPREKRKSVMDEINREVACEVDLELQELEKESRKKLEQEQASVNKMRETAQNAAQMMKKQMSMKNLQKEKEEKRIRELQEKHFAQTELLEERSKHFETRAKEEMMNSKKEMEEMLHKMQADFAKKAKKQEEEKQRQQLEQQQKMEAMQKAMEEAKAAAEESARIVKEKKEQNMMKALQKRASNGGAGPNQDLALRAFKAAQARLAMPRETRELARKRWKDAARRVLSPAQQIKRAMGNFSKQKVSQNQTVVRRVEKLEEENKEYYKRIHQLEKLCKKLNGKVLKEAAAEYAMGKRLDSMVEATDHIGIGLLDLKETVTGYSAQLAFASLEGSRDEEDKKGPSAIVRLSEASNKEVVVNRIEEAAKKACPEILSNKLSHIATKLSRPNAIDFDAEQVALLIEDVLVLHSAELDDLQSNTKTERYQTHKLKHKPQMRSLGSVVFTKSVLEDTEADAADAEELVKNDYGLSLTDILRLELYRLMGGGSGAGGGGKKKGDLSGYLESEVDRLDGERREMEKDLQKRMAALKKRADQLDNYQHQLASSLEDMGIVDAKVADIKTLLQMKAEKQELDNIGNVIGGVRDDLHAIRGALPPKSLTDSVRNMKSEVDKKANRSEVNRLRKDLKDLNTDTADPAITNRCLSCDRPLAPAPSPEQIGQLALSLELTAFNHTRLKQSLGGANPGLPAHWSSNSPVRVPLGSTVTGDPYKSYTKPKSLYSSLKNGSSIRPKSAKPRMSGGGSSGGGSREMVMKDGKQTALDKQREAMKYGFTKPLHMQLFDNVKVPEHSGSGGNGGGNSSSYSYNNNNNNEFAEKRSTDSSGRKVKGLGMIAAKGGVEGGSSKGKIQVRINSPAA